MNFDNVGMSFIKKDQLKDGATVKIVSPEPQVIESTRFKNEKTGQPSKQYVWKVVFNGQEASLPLNMTSIKYIKAEYGPESAGWVGKSLACKVVFDMKTSKNNYYWMPVKGENPSDPKSATWEE